MDSISDQKNISVKDYTYDLPLERIAQFPLEDRDSSKLLLYNGGNISETVFSKIYEHIHEKPLMVFNDTRVIRARLHFQKETGAVIEIFCLEPHGSKKEIQEVFHTKGSCVWNCLVGNASKWKSGILGKSFDYNGTHCKISAKKDDSNRNEHIIEFKWKPEELTFSEVLSAAGEVPLPPYVKREAEELDKKRYQTIYAVNDGSVAAPTAGLHFTENVLSNLKKKEAEFQYITLHVGLGTFRPIKTETLEDHIMHEESVCVSKNLIENILNCPDKQIIAVGTTALRTLESIYWFGLKLYVDKQKKIDKFYVSQWQPYEYEKNELIPKTRCLEVVLDMMENEKADYLYGDTRLMVVPGYNFQIVDVLVTNFHMSAFIGKDWKNVYDYALKNDFRFLSYGDSSLLFRN